MPDLGLNLSQQVAAERAAEYQRARAAGEIPRPETPEEPERLNPEWPYEVIPFDPEALIF